MKLTFMTADAKALSCMENLLTFVTMLPTIAITKNYYWKNCEF